MMRRNHTARFGWLLLAGALGCSCSTGRCSSPGGQGASIAKKVTTAGGTVELDSARLDIPPAAVEREVTIKVSTLTTPVPDTHVAYTALHRFEPEGQTFATPSTIRFTRPGGWPLGASIFWSRRDGDGYEALPGRVEGDAIVAEVSHFSTGFVGNKLPSSVTKPATWAITLPWTAGVTHGIILGYDSGKHRNKAGGAQDQYALDFDLTRGEAVRAIADGTVAYAGEASGDWASYGKIVFINHPVNGVIYNSFYAHLDSVAVKTNDVIVRGQQIGGAGDSGDQAEVHLHLAVYKGASVFRLDNGTGPARGEAVNPEPFDECDKGNRVACTNLVTGNRLTYTSQQQPPGPGRTTCDNGVPLGGTACNPANTAVEYVCVDPSRTDVTQWQSRPCSSGQTCVGAACQGSAPPPPTSCGSTCTQCILAVRTDILPFYQGNGWDTSCGNRDSIITDWCRIDATGCRAVKTGACAASCGGGSTNPYPNCPCNRIDNYCQHPPLTAGCPMTLGDGYCDRDNDRDYRNGDWVRGYNEYQAYCRR